MKEKINWGALFYAVLILGLILLIAGLASSKNKNKIMTDEIKNVVIQTNLGDIELALYPAKAPKTVENFIKLSYDGFYDNTKYHRVIKGFMIQGGDPYTKGEDTSVWGTGGPGYKFADEFNDVPMVRGVIAMANSGPNTNGSQFFIITAPATPWLTGKHTAFGKIISGMDVVDKIEAVKTTGSPYDRPLIPVIINKVIIK